MIWISAKDERKPKRGQIIICFCPEWNEERYQIAQWSVSQKEFCYESQPNDMFNEHVESWSIFLEAD